MRLLISLCLVFIINKSVYGSGKTDTYVFHKCCSAGQNLVRVTNSQGEDHFQCSDNETTELMYNVSHASLLIGEKVDVKYGMISDCDEIQMQRVIEDENDSTSVDNKCFDNLVVEVVNGTEVNNIPKTVVLKCISKESSVQLRKTFKIDQVRKCCPEGKSYDIQYHSCRDDINNKDRQWLNKWMGRSDNKIYEFVYDMHCKSNNYAVELRESSYQLQLDGSHLIVRSANGELLSQVPKGEWCIEKEFSTSIVLARVCTSDCALYGAFCIRKCCPFGYHFEVVSCHSPKSVCVLNTDTVAMYNVSKFIDPVVKKYGEITDVMGISPTFQCPRGKFIINETADPFWLDQHGHIESPSLKLMGPNIYCLEAIDRRMCPRGNVEVHGLTCFEPERGRSFQISRILLIISAICLTLTLLVYIGLPELQNLHGRTLICHVSPMLLAYSCLARVQFGEVIDQNICMMLGYGIYFGFVASFVWLNVMCFDIWWTFGSIRTVQPMSKVSAERKRFAWYSLYAWSLALALTLTTYLLDQYPISPYLDSNIGVQACWFGAVQNSKTDWPHYIFFVIPMGIVTCTNFLLWVLTARHCARIKSEVHRMQAGSFGDRAKKRFRLDRAKHVLTVRLWVIMGAGWVYELLSTIWTQPQWLWKVLDSCNELQGLFIFLILVFKPKVYSLIRKRLGMEKPEAKNGTTSSGRTSSTFLSRGISTEERTNLRTSLPNDKLA